MINIARIIADLRRVAEHWPGLVETRIPGTLRPYCPPTVAPEIRAERDAEARAERLERSGLAPGEHSAPVDVAVLDHMSSILADADDIADRVAQAAGVDHLDPPSSALADARPYLYAAIVWLPAVGEQARQTGCPRHTAGAVEGCQACGATGDRAETAAAILEDAGQLARRMVADVTRALALVYDGQRLAVTCPWCRGITAETPAGGARTWVVRQLPGDQTAIVCEGTCEPPSKDVGTWWKGQPCWPMAEWDWLAQRVRHADGDAA